MLAKKNKLLSLEISLTQKNTTTSAQFLDEYNNVASSYYNTKLKLFNNTEINTKLLRFRINNLHNIKLSQNAKLILESVYLPCVFDNNLDIKHDTNIVLRLKNISDSKCFNSSNDNESSPIIFSHSVQSRPEPIVRTLTTTLSGAVSTYNNQALNINYYNSGIIFLIHHQINYIILLFQIHLQIIRYLNLK